MEVDKQKKAQQTGGSIEQLAEKLKKLQDELSKLLKDERDHIKTITQRSSRLFCNLSDIAVGHDGALAAGAVYSQGQFDGIFARVDAVHGEHEDFEEGTLGAISVSLRNDPLVKVVKFIGKYNTDFYKENRGAKVVSLINKIDQAAMVAAVNARKAGVPLSTIKETFVVPAGTSPFEGATRASNGRKIVFTDDQSRAFQSNHDGLEACNARRTKIIGAIVSTFNEKTPKEILSVVYTNPEAKKEERTPKTPGEIAEALAKQSKDAVAIDVGELDLKPDGSASRKATCFGIGVGGGYMFRFGDVTVSPVAGVCIVGGKKLKVTEKGAAKGSPGLTVKTKLRANIGVQLGRFVSPVFEVFAGAGLGIGIHETDPTGINKTLDKSDAFINMAKAYNEKCANKEAKDLPDDHPDKPLEIQTDEQTSKPNTTAFKRASKTGFAPYCELGTRVHCGEGVFVTAKLGIEPKHSIGKPKKTGVKVKQETIYGSFGVGIQFGG
jgi:hypothetical protein